MVAVVGLSIDKMHWVHDILKLWLLLLSWCFTSTETIRLIRDGRREAGKEGGRLYTCHYTVATQMTPALRWAVMRTILMFH